MYYEFYIDQFAAEHILSGCLLLMITARVLKRKVPRIRIVTGSIVQTAIVILFLFAEVSWGYVFALAAAGIVTFGKKEKGLLLRVIGTLFAVTICFGGILEVLMNVMHVPAVVGMTAAAAVLYAAIWLQERKHRAGVSAAVTLRRGEKTIHVQALVDTGNHLREPLTGSAVSILASSEAKKLLEEGWEQEKGFFLIPYHSLGRERAWMRGVSIDEMKVEQDNRITEVKRVVLAIYEGQISSAGRYQMILHPEHAAGGRE